MSNSQLHDNRIFNYLKRNAAILIISLISAILVWFIISINVFPDMPKTIEDVAVEQISLDGTIAGAMNLSVVSADIPSTVDVKIQGARTRIGDIRADQLTAKVNVSDVKAAGKYTLDIIIESTEGIDFETTYVSVPSVNVEFDEIITVSLPIDEISISQLQFAQDLYYDREDITVEPDVVEINGPKSEIERIGKIVAMPESESEISESTNILTNNIQLYTADNSLIDLSSSKLNLQNEEFYVNINLSVKKTLPIKPKIVNTNSTTSSFDVSTLEGKYSLSVDEITLISDDEFIRELSEIETEEINLLDIEPGSVIEVPLSIPDGCENLSGVTSVRVTFNLEDYDVKNMSSISCTDIVVKNLPSQYDISFITNSVSVTLVGPADELFGDDPITTLDVVLSVDFSKEDSVLGSRSIPVTVSIADSDAVWAAGDTSKYIVSVDVSKKDTESSEE
ncbi:MAG: hypothetical protein IJO29_05945 [Oscillospiraceae bacterium]|nr:hypothetical protein [Oscillospiraceae bacterium]